MNIYDDHLAIGMIMAAILIGCGCIVNAIKGKNHKP